MIMTPEQAEGYERAGSKADAGRCLCSGCGARLLSVWHICKCISGMKNQRVVMVDDGVMTVENERREHQG